MKQWFRRKQPDRATTTSQPGRWPVALSWSGPIELGSACVVQTQAGHTPGAAPVTAIYLTDAGLRRPILVGGDYTNITSQTLVRLAARVLEDPHRRLVYICGHDPVDMTGMTCLMRLAGRMPLVWTPVGTRPANWIAADDAAMHRRLREVLLDSAAMRVDSETVDLIIHTLLSLSPDPLRCIDDLVARCRTLYAYAAQMQSEAARTAAKVLSFTALTPPAHLNGAEAAAAYEACATRRCMLDWAIKSDLRLLTEIGDLFAARLYALSPVLNSDGFSLAEADTLAVALPPRTTAEQRAQRRFVLEAILHDLLLSVDPQRPVTLVLDSVSEVCQGELPILPRSSTLASQTLVERIAALPKLAGHGLDVMFSAPDSPCLIPELWAAMQAAEPIAFFHVSLAAEPALPALSGRQTGAMAAIQSAGKHGELDLTLTPVTVPNVPASRIWSLDADEAYLATGSHAALVRIVPIQVDVKVESRK